MERSVENIVSSAGTIVWVKIKNGRWWPGIVLGPEETPKNQGGITKTRIPVKLLGKKDGGLHWLDPKSTRLKSFRCGEHDDAIEKAKDDALRYKKLISNRKKVERKHAIVHALELENSHSFNQIIRYGSRKNSSARNKIAGVGPELNTINGNETPLTFTSKSGKYTLHKEGRKFSNDDTLSGIKRTRSLQDLEAKGLKGRCASHSNSIFLDNISTENHLKDNRDSSSTVRRKRANKGKESIKHLKKKCCRKAPPEVNADIRIERYNSFSKKVANQDCLGSISCQEAILASSTSIANVEHGCSLESTDAGIFECLFDSPATETGYSIDPSSIPSAKKKKSSGKKESKLARSLKTIPSSKSNERKGDCFIKGKGNTRPQGSNNCITDQNSSDLYNVAISAQANYNVEQVPVVSLISKFCKKAIVGHPIVVEILSYKESGVSHGRKIRKLSSFVINKQSEVNKSRRVSMFDKTNSSSVSCVPLRLVFSRLKETLKRS